MNATVNLTHDGTYIAVCRLTGRSASGRTREIAIRNFNSFAFPSQAPRANEQRRASDIQPGTAPPFEQTGGNGDEE